MTKRSQNSLATSRAREDRRSSEEVDRIVDDMLETILRGQWTGRATLCRYADELGVSAKTAQVWYGRALQLKKQLDKARNVDLRSDDGFPNAYAWACWAETLQEEDGDRVLVTTWAASITFITRRG